MSKALELLADEFIDTLLPKLGPAMLELAKKAVASEPDPLLSVTGIAMELGLSASAARLIVEAGHIPIAKGLKEIRCRRSEVRKYATTHQTNK